MASRRPALARGRRFLDKLREWVRAEAGAGRLLPWVPIAFGTGIAFYFAADHEPVLPVAAVTAIGLCAAAFLLRRQRIFPVAVMVAAMAAGFATATWKTARIAHGVLARPAYSVSLSGFVETRDIRERTDRFVLRVTQMDGPRLTNKPGARPAVGAQGHRARGRQLCRIEGAAAAAARPVAAGQLRFRPRHVLSGHRRLRLCHRRHQDRRAAGRGRPVPALRRLHAGPARRDRRADTDDARRRQARHRDRASDRPARRDHHAGQRCDVHLRPRPRAVDFGISHGGRRRRRVLRHPRAAGAVPGADRRLSDQEMGGRRQRLPRRPFICCCRAPKSPRNARST